MVITKTIVIYPKGSLTNRILVMVSAIVYARYYKYDIKLIWDHVVSYDNLFLGNIDVVPISFFQDKNYIYNPQIDQQELLEKIKTENKPNMYYIVETSNEIMAKDMREAVYLIERTSVYRKLLKEHISGSLLGQISLVDFPDRPFCCVRGEFATDMLRLDIDNDIFDIVNKEVLEYVRTLIYCKASVLICSENENDIEMNNAADISLTTVIYTKPIDYASGLIKNYAREYMGYGLTINPDINKISLL